MSISKCSDIQNFFRYQYCLLCLFINIARYVYFAGLDAELLEMAGILREILWERDRVKSGDTQFMDFVIEHQSAY